MIEGVFMGRRGRKRDLNREVQYWEYLASGVGTVEACQLVGVSRKTGYRWRAEMGGVIARKRSEGSGRYLSMRRTAHRRSTLRRKFWFGSKASFQVPAHRSHESSVASCALDVGSGNSGGGPSGVLLARRSRERAACVGEYPRTWPATRRAAERHDQSCLPCKPRASRPSRR